MDRNGITRILPHREPVLLVDRLTGISFEEEAIAGSRFISPADPVFAGHFPDFPVYPGTLEVEMIGQLGLCLHYFLKAGAFEIPPKSSRFRCGPTRITRRVLTWSRSCRDGKSRSWRKKLDHDEFLATMSGR